MLTVTTPATSSALCTLAAVKSELNITATTDDTYLTSQIDAASAAIAAACNRTGFGAETLLQTERLSSTRNCIILDRDLVPVLTSVTLDGTALVAGTDYELDGMLLYRLAGTSLDVWSGSVVTIAYTAGYALPGSAPADLARAAVLTVSAWYAARGRDPLLRSEVTEGVGSASWVATDTTTAIPPQALALLGGYTAVVL